MILLQVNVQFLGVMVTQIGRKSLKSSTSLFCGKVNAKEVYLGVAKNPFFPFFSLPFSAWLIVMV